MKHQILLYYKYVHVDDPKKLMADQRALCEKLGLTGRIIVAHEGINGTVGGTVENTEKYVEEMEKDTRFAKIHWKRSAGLEKSFPRLSIKVRNEIVEGKLGKNDINPNAVTGKKLKPEELHAWFQSGKKFKIVDMRNSYEYRFGRFVGSIDPGMDKFRELPKKVKNLLPLKEETVLTVCTGGVRCEKASGYLVKKGFKDVYQLDGGMVSYMEKYPGENYEGSLFVFDNRQVMHFNGDKHHAISHCDFCGATSEIMRNCSDEQFCNNKIIACKKCAPQDRVRKCLECEKRNPLINIFRKSAIQIGRKLSRRN